MLPQRRRPGQGKPLLQCDNSRIDAEAPMDRAPHPPLDRDAPLRREDRGGVAVLTLDRPRRYNALDSGLLDALHRAVDAIATDESVRVVMITGSGKAFCSGHDLREIR